MRTMILKLKSLETGRSATSLKFQLSLDRKKKRPLPNSDPKFTGGEKNGRKEVLVI